MSDDWDEFERSVREELVPKLETSVISVCLVPTGEADVKFAVELGLSIMLDKPIIALVSPGVKVPDHLVRVADAIVEFDEASDNTPKRLGDAINDLRERGLVP